MSICEHCANEHDSSYGSGRFCSAKCARAFSTASRRNEINQQVSLKLKGQPATGKSFQKGYDERRKTFTAAERKKIVAQSKQQRLERYAAMAWDELPIPEKRRRILMEQEHVCVRCQMKEWLGEKLILELDHIDGDRQNNQRENLRLLCPNCHSLTSNYRRRNSKNQKQISDEQLLTLLSSSDSIHAALIKAGLTPKAANYERVFKLVYK